VGPLAHPHPSHRFPPVSPGFSPSPWAPAPTVTLSPGTCLAPIPPRYPSFVNDALPRRLNPGLIIPVGMSGRGSGAGADAGMGMGGERHLPGPPTNIPPMRNPPTSIPPMSIPPTSIPPTSIAPRGTGGPRSLGNASRGIQSFGNRTWHPWWVGGDGGGPACAPQGLTPGAARGGRS